MTTKYTNHLFIIITGFLFCFFFLIRIFTDLSVHDTVTLMGAGVFLMIAALYIVAIVLFALEAVLKLVKRFVVPSHRESLKEPAEADSEALAANSEVNL